MTEDESPDAGPIADIARVADAHARFDAVIAALTEAGARAPSRLPGWSIGHLLTHVARNADSHLLRTRGALAGEMVDQYPGGAAERSGAIDAGADRSAPELVADVAATSAAVDAAWSDVAATAWPNGTRDLSGRERPLSELPGRRWLEVEIHLVDIGRPGDPTYQDWSDDFVTVWLPHQRAGIESRLPAGSSAPAPGSLDEREELAWLFGRSRRPDLPTLTHW